MVVAAANFVSRRPRSQQLHEEVQFHIDQQIEENVAAGMSPEKARQAAMRTFGNVSLIQEDARGTWGWIWLEQFAQDLRFGARSLRRVRGSPRSRS